MWSWWIFLVFLISKGLAQKNCGRTRADFAPPVFGPGDNLSAEGCGIWDQYQEYAPWLVIIDVIGDTGTTCAGALITPTSVLISGCSALEEEFRIAETRPVWRTARGTHLFTAHVGNCAFGGGISECLKSGKGQRLKVENVTRLVAPGYPRPLYIWKIQRAKLKENFIAPICISNTGNRQDFDKSQEYMIYPQWNKGNQYSAKLSEDFGPCLNQSEKYETCDKVHQSFLCARSSGNDYWGTYLTHQVKNRHFLRALVVEDIVGHDFFYYDLYPILDQIVSVSGQNISGCGSKSTEDGDEEDEYEDDDPCKK